MDMPILMLLADVLKMKLDQIKALQRKREMEKEIVPTIKIAGQICTQTSQI